MNGSDGESTEKWAMRQSGFFGSIKQLTHCARCGEPLPAKPHNEPSIFDTLKPTVHFVCDECYDALPD